MSKIKDNESYASPCSNPNKNSIIFCFYGDESILKIID